MEKWPVIVVIKSAIWNSNILNFYSYEHVKNFREIKMTDDEIILKFLYLGGISINCSPFCE